MVSKEDIPSYLDLYLPVLRALDGFNGSATSRQIVDEVIERTDFGQELASITYRTRDKSILSDRIAWAMSYCNLAGLVRKPSRALYVITQDGRALLSMGKVGAQAQVKKIDTSVRRERRSAAEQRKRAAALPGLTHEPVDERTPVEHIEDPNSDGDDSWHEPLLQQLHDLSDRGFERLAQVVLQRYGLELEHTGGTGDDGIDCLGVAPVSDVMSATVAVQVKRREPSTRIGREAVALLQRDASNAGAERAILVTSGQFTSGARRAARETTPTVHLIDGPELCDLMYKRRIGVLVAPQPDIAFFRDLENP